MSIGGKLLVKIKLNSELADVKSAVENIVADCERRFPDRNPALVEELADSMECHVSSKAIMPVQPYTSSKCYPSFNSDNYQMNTGNKRKASEMKFKMKISKNHHEENMLSEKSEKRSVSTSASMLARQGSGTKCGTGDLMNISKMRQCANLLKALMNHPSGWVFNQPVDPVKLNIPDYFSIITRPMDLGTIRKKLANKHYMSTAQFAADIRLTFDNAMKYNPSGNEVHVMAKELNNLFNSTWRSLDGKWRSVCGNSSVQSMTNSKQSKVVQKKPTEINNVIKQPEQQLCKGIISPQSVFPCTKAFLNPSGCIKGVDSDMNSRLNNLDQVSSSDVDSKGLPGRDNQFYYSSACKVDSLEVSAGMQDANHSLRTNGCDLDNNHVAKSNSDSFTPTESASEEADLPCEEQLSPTKALRAALLKSRFADTILKAQHQRLGEKVDPVKLQEEREKLEKKQLEEKARIEAQVKAKEEAEARKQRDMERKAARLALLQIEKAAGTNVGCPPPGHYDMTNDIVANFMKEFDLHYGMKSPLEKLGLFMKKEDCDEEVDNWSAAAEHGDMEEGEIQCF